MEGWKDGRMEGWILMFCIVFWHLSEPGFSGLEICCVYQTDMVELFSKLIDFRIEAKNVDRKNVICYALFVD